MRKSMFQGKTVSRRGLLRSGLVLGAGTVAALALSGCGEEEKEAAPAPAATAAPTQVVVATEAPPTAEKVTIKMWTASVEDINPIHEEEAANFTSMMPNVSIDLTLVPWSDVQTKQLTSLAAGDKPDIAYTHSELNSTFAWRGVLQSLDEFMAADGDFDRDDFFAGPLENLSYRGKVTGVPMYSGPVIFVYNREMIGELGFDDPWEMYKEGRWTIDAYEQIVRAAATGSGADRVYGDRELPNALKIWWLWIQGFDGQVWNEKVSESLMHEANALKAWDWATTLVKDEVWADSTVTGAFSGGAEGMFVSNKMPIYLASRWVTTNIPEEFPAGTAPMYKMPNGDDNGRDGTDGVGMHAETKHPDEAWAVLKHWATTVMDRFVEIRYTNPTRRSVLNSPAWAGAMASWDNVEVHNASLEQIRRGFYHPPGYREINTILKKAYDEVKLGQKNSADAFSAIKPDIDAILQESSE